MKNKTTVIIVVVVILLLLGAGAYKLMHHFQNAASLAGQSANPQASQSSTQNKSLFDLLSMAGSQKCTFSSSNSSGTVYVSDGKMRGDFQSQNEGKNGASHMLNDGSYVYIWTDGQQNGYKMSLAVVRQQEAQVTESPSSGGSQAQPSQAVNMQQKSNYSCGPWSAVSSMFTVPTNVTFTDYSSMMQGSTSHSAVPQGGSANSVKGSAAMCAECNQAPAGSARNQCLAALHCQ